MKKTFVLATAAAALLAASLGQANADTLADVKAKGFVQCGVNTGLAGFAAPDDQGNWAGLDVDYCKALAAAIFGDASKVKFSPLNAKERFTALQSKEVDILSRNTTSTMDRDTNLALDFVGIAYYDGQGFMVRKESGLKSAKEMKGASVCVQSGTTTETNLGDFSRANKLDIKSVVYEKVDEVRQAYDQGRCDAYTADASGLAAERSVLSKPEDHVILPDIISKEPLGPATREDDPKWTNVARWTLNALIIAEELGVTQANVDEMAKSENPEIKRLLGSEGDFGTKIGLNNDWAHQAIKAVGNYGEIFERNVGMSTKLKLERGLNQLWSKGGILYAAPIR